MANEEMIKLTVKRIEQDLSKWDQGSWFKVPAEFSEFKLEWMAPEGAKVPLPKAVTGMEEYQNTVNPDFCGTTFCFAGHALMAAGGIPLLAYDNNMGTWCLDPSTGKVRTVPSAAMDILGLDDDEAARLFEASLPSDLPAFKALITEVTGVAFDGE